MTTAHGASSVLEAPTLQATSTDPSDSKHLVDQDQPGNVSITEAIVLGIEVTALCGYRWIPCRDDEERPACKACLSILEAYDGSYGFAY